MTLSSDPLAIASASLARGDVLGALSAVGARDDAQALALRGVAMAQLREYPAARRLLAASAEAFRRAGDPLGRARARAALAEVAIAERGRPEGDLVDLARELSRLGDFANAAWAELVEARRRVLHGELEEAHAGIERARVLAE